MFVLDEEGILWRLNYQKWMLFLKSSAGGDYPDIGEYATMVEKPIDISGMEPHHFEELLGAELTKGKRHSR